MSNHLPRRKAVEQVGEIPTDLHHERVVLVLFFGNSVSFSCSHFYESSGFRAACKSNVEVVVAAPVPLPVRSAQDYRMIVFEPLDEQRAAYSTVNMAAVVKPSSGDLLSVQALKVCSGLAVLLEYAAQRTDRHPQLTGYAREIFTVAQKIPYQVRRDAFSVTPSA